MSVRRWITYAAGEPPPARVEALTLTATALAVAGFYLSPHPVLTAAWGAALVFLGWIRLQVILMAVLASVPFFRFPKVFDPGLLGIAGRGNPIEVSLAESLILIALFAWGLRWLRPPAGSPAAPAPVGTAGWLPAVAFIAAGLLSLPAADNRTVALREFRLVVLEPAVYYLLLVHTLRSAAEVLRFLAAFALLGGAIGAYGLYHYALVGVVERTGGVERILAVYHSPNALALFLGRVIPVAAVLLWGVGVVPGLGRGARLAAGLTAGLALAAMVATFYLTYSRGAFIGLGAALSWALLLAHRRAGLALLAAAGIVAVIALPLLPQDRLLAPTPLFQRTYVWEAALAMLRDHPLTGIGLDNFLYHYPRYMLPQAALEPDMSHPHNLLLDHWLRLGVAGVAIGVALQWFFWSNVRRALRDPTGLYVRIAAIALGGSMVDFLVHGLIDNSYFLIDLAFIFWLTLGLIVTLNRTQPVKGTLRP